jgi:hypothetical protein
MRAILHPFIVAGLLCATSAAAWADAISCLGNPRRTSKVDYEFRNSCPSPVRYVIRSMSPDRKVQYVTSYASPAPSGIVNQDSWFDTPPQIVWACTTGDAGCSDAAAGQAQRRFASGDGSPARRSAAQVQCEKYNGTWVDGHCRAWCEDHPHETIPDAGGATCDGE